MKIVFVAWARADLGGGATDANQKPPHPYMRIMCVRARSAKGKGPFETEVTAPYDGHGKTHTERKNVELQQRDIY